MGDTKNPDRHTVRGQKHGNETGGIRKAMVAMQKGKPFTGFALECYREALQYYGYSEADLPALGTLGLVVSKSAMLSAISKMLWSSILMAAEVGNVAAFHTLERNYAKRLTQSLNADYRLLDMQREESDGTIIDAAVDAAKEAK